METTKQDWRELLATASSAWSDGDVHAALQLCDRAALLGAEARYHAALLRGDFLLELGDAAGALSSYDAVADPDTADPELDCARGVALFEQVRLAEAEIALQSALRGNPELAQAHYFLGLIAELLMAETANDSFRQARRLAPDSYPPLQQLSQQDFEKLVEEAVQKAPAQVQKALELVPLVIAELPHPDDLKNREPPLSPLSPGFYIGPPLAEIAEGRADDDEKPAMVLYKRTLERTSTDRAAIVREIHDVVVYEMNAALGLSDDDV